MYLNQVKKRLKGLEPNLNELLMECRIIFDNVNIWDLSAEKAQLYTELYRMSHKLDYVLGMIDYFNKEIICEASLRKKENGRYELGDIELSSGMQIEVWCEDTDMKEGGHYQRTTIEHNGEDYYARCMLNSTLEGRMARIRG